MLSKNQHIPLTITGMTAEGNGVGRYTEDGAGSGMAVFVPFTAVGDTLDCHVMKVQSHCAYGKLEQLTTPSPDRLPTVDCPVFGKCGGCAFRHVSYEAELRYKQQRVADAIRRIGGINAEVQPIVGCDFPDRYRNKGQYPVTPGKYRPQIGLYAARSHRVVEQHDCLLQPAVFKTVLDTVAVWMKKAGVEPYDEIRKQGLLRHIYIREGARSKERMVCLVCTSGKLPQPTLLVDLLRAAVPNLVSVTVNLNKNDTNVILGDTGFTLYGKDHITDTLCDLRFRISPLSFYQVNTDQAEKLYRLAGELAELTGKETLLDLYCGTGTIGLSLANKAAQVIGVEVVPQAVEDAIRNAAENGIQNARFLTADAAKAAEQLKKEGITPDVIIVDPPRKGCDEALIRTMADMAPRRIVYVSCDPATLARDLKRLAEQGYTTETVVPVDMFPRTAHVETIVCLCKQSFQH